MIKLVYSSIDGCRKKASYKTLKGAQRFAHKWVGETPEISCLGYAVSPDGIGKVVVLEGCVISDLFPDADDGLTSEEYGLGYMQGRGAS
jgi:hypothetical protein